MADIEKGIEGVATGAAAGTAVQPGIGTLIGAGLGLVSGLFGGGSKTESGFKLPPAMEFKMLQDSKQNLEMLQENIGEIDNLVAQFDQRINLISQGIEGTIPPQALTQQLTSINANIAMSLGADAQELIDNGFMDADDIARIEELDQYNDQEFVDQQFEQEFSMQRQALEQQMRRDGLTPGQIQQSLAAFDSNKAVERQQRGETLRQGAFDRGLMTLQAQQQSRQLGFGQATNAFQLGQAQQNQMYNQSFQGFQTMASLAGARQDAAMQGIGAQANLAGVSQSIYGELGKFKLDSRAADNVMAGKDYAYHQATKPRKKKGLWGALKNIAGAVGGSIVGSVAGPIGSVVGAVAGGKD